jgi:predicted Abi (CAAX) family protease
LQALQLEAISSEVENLLNYVQVSVMHVDLSIYDILHDTQAIVEDILVDTREVLIEAAGEVRLPISPLTKRQVLICYRTYEHPVEWMTLHSFLTQSFFRPIQLSTK